MRNFKKNNSILEHEEQKSSLNESFSDRERMPERDDSPSLALSESRFNRDSTFGKSISLKRDGFNLEHKGLKPFVAFGKGGRVDSPSLALSESRLNRDSTFGDCIYAIMSNDDETIKDVYNKLDCTYENVVLVGSFILTEIIFHDMDNNYAKTMLLLWMKWQIDKTSELQWKWWGKLNCLMTKCTNTKIHKKINFLIKLIHKLTIVGIKMVQVFENNDSKSNVALFNDLCAFEKSFFTNMNFIKNISSKEPPKLKEQNIKSSSTKINKEVQLLKWREECEIEIKKRLKLLVDRIGIEFLSKKMKIKLISASEFDDYIYDDKIVYYQTVYSQYNKFISQTSKFMKIFNLSILCLNKKIEKMFPTQIVNTPISIIAQNETEPLLLSIDNMLDLAILQLNKKN